MGQLINLWKVERYRFSRNIRTWIFMAGVLLFMMFSASDNTDMLLGDDTLLGNISAVMKMVNLLIIFMVSVAVSAYIGTEFKHKTICYEVMNGYKMWKISVVKTLTCGMINAVLLQISILVYIKIMSGKQQIYSWVSLLLMFIVICHICTCITLYVILLRDGAMGGCLAFVRYTLLSVVGMFMAELFLPQSVYDTYMALSPMSEWNVVIYAGYDIPVRYMVGIPVSFFLEYAILIAAINLSSKKVDF